MPVDAMISEVAYAKINLALHVRARRPDGYHELDTIFAFVDDGDHLSASHSEQAQPGNHRSVCTGIVERRR